MSFKPKAQTSLDSYKLGHPNMYPPGTKKVYSNFTPRSLHHLNAKVPDPFKVDSIVWFGIQAVIRELVENWQETFFSQAWFWIESDFLRITRSFTGDHIFPIEKLKYLHDLGYLPILVKALPEGSRVPQGVPVFTITNTDENCYWLTNNLETVLSTESWLMSNSATIASIYRSIIDYWAFETGGSKEFVQWQGHDFSMRGMEGVMAAAKSGAGHLLSFTGTDVVPAVEFLEYYYEGDKTFIGGSVPASEHSVMTFNGPIGEQETIRRIIQDVYPTGVVSIVADSFDYWKTITEYASNLKDIILGRQPDSLGLAKVVFRPDSGDPVKIIAGYRWIEYDSWESAERLFATEREDYNAVLVGNVGRAVYSILDEETDSVFVSWGKELTLDELNGSVQLLYNIFGGTTNDLGFTTLDSHVGLIYGDSITMEVANEILETLAAKGFASDNIVFGLGSYTYQYNTRDTLGFAMKATYGVNAHDAGIEIFKDPKTDNGLKKSAKGLLRVEFQEGKFVLYDQQTPEQEYLLGELRQIFKDGQFYNEESLETIRERVAGK